MDLKKLLGSKEYRDARSKVDKWRSKLEKGGKGEAAAVRDEKAAFFARMRSGNPGLYAAFRIDDKELSEAIYGKLTGKKILLD